MDQPFNHSVRFRTRRFFNWFPLGLSYALLYMGRYNLTVSKTELGPLMSKEAFGTIFGIGAITYGIAFLINGPLTDKIGGKKAILIAMLGSGIMNFTMGLYVQSILMSEVPPDTDAITSYLTMCYAANMYFQSFGAVAIVKVNSHWFHVRERGGFSGIFGTMISSGIFLAFTVNFWLLGFTEGWGPRGGSAAWWIFFAPASLLGVMFVIEFFLLKDRPGQAGLEDFDTGDASSGDTEDYNSVELIKRILTNPVIMTVALIEFCTGILRNGVMHWFPIYAKEVWVLPGSHFIRYGSWGNWLYTVLPFFVGSFVLFFVAYKLRKADAAKNIAKARLITVAASLCFLAPFLQGGWGGILMVAGVIGGNVAGWLSDIVFNSRRAPTAAILYGLLIVSSLFMLVTMGGDTNEVGRVMVKKKTNTIASLKMGGSGLGFEKGDVIVGVQGKKGLKNWKQVSKAYACVPATCSDEGSRWDTKQCTCSKSAKASKNAPKVPESITVTLLRNKKEVTVKIPNAKMRILRMRVLPVRPKKEKLKYPIQKGDKIIAVAGTKDIKTWTQTAKAIACIPAVCKGKNISWDTQRCVCTKKPKATSKTKIVAAATIPVTLLRGGKTLNINLKNPKPQLKAGSKRKLPLAPKLAVNPFWLCLIVFLMSLGVIGTHGLLSGTATMDFGGRKGAATAVGVIDGFVYLGTGIQSIALGYLTSQNWTYWPLFLFPFGVIGFFLLIRIWHAIPSGKKGGH